jgi:hypothetical protein
MQVQLRSHAIRGLILLANFRVAEAVVRNKIA